MKISNLLKNDDGLTLVELLGSIVILSFVAIALFSIITNSGSQYNEQISENQQINNVAYALKVITKDIRKYPTNIKVESNNIEITTNSETIIYSHDTSTSSLNKSGASIVSNIEDFKVDYCTRKSDNQNLVKDNSCIFIEIGNEEKTVSTEIIMRKGN